MMTSAMAWTNPTSASERDGHHVRTKKKTSLLLFPQLLSDGLGKLDRTKSVKSLSLIIMSNKLALIVLE